MKTESKQKREKDNRTYLESNPEVHKTQAKKALEKAKALEAKKLASGKTWHTSKDRKTSYLK